MAATQIGFSWVNYSETSVLKTDDEDISIIKSHAMRMVHQERQKGPFPSITNQNKPAKGRRPQKRIRTSVSRQRRENIAPNLETDWEEVAICRFLQDFVYPEPTSPVMAFQYLGFLPQVYNKYSNQSCLTLSVSAVALARFANQVGASGLLIRARETYAKALTLVNKSMFTPELRKTDQVLTSLCLLTKYELVSGDATTSSWQSHERGQIALLCERGPEWLRSYTGASLFRLVYIRHLLNCVALSKQPAISLDYHSRNLVFPTPALTQLLRLTDRVASTRHDLSKLPQGCFKDSAEACRIADDAIKIDAELTALARDLPEELRYNTMSINAQLPKGTRKAYAPKTVHIFKDLQHASFWHVVFYVRLHVLQTLLQLVSFQLTFESEELQNRILNVVNDTCASVPFALNESDGNIAFLTTKGGRAVAAHYLIWLLVAALSVPGLPQDQIGWISDRLQFIGFEHGIKEALFHI